MNIDFTPIVTDDRPTIAQKILPIKAIHKVIPYFTSIKQNYLEKLLGKNFILFNEFINKIMLLAKLEERPELNVPVIPLCYYNALLERYPQDREALKAHGLSHAFRPISYPEYRYWWRHIIDAIRVVLELNMGIYPLADAVQHFCETGLIVASLFPTEEMIATYLRDSTRASRARKLWLEYFGRREIKNNNEWPYILAYKIIYILSGCGLDTNVIEEIIRLCDYQANLHYFNRTQSAKGYLSNLPYLINVLRHVEEIKGKPLINKLKLINEKIENPEETRSFKFCSPSSDSINEEVFNVIKTNKIPNSKEIWNTWKRINFQHYLDADSVSVSLLYCISDLIISSFVTVEGRNYELLFPAGIIQIDLKEEEKKLLIETLALIKILLFHLNSFLLKLDFRGGDEIEEFGEKIVFPKINIDYTHARRLLKKLKNEEFVEEIKVKLKKIANESRILRKNCKSISLDKLEKVLSSFHI